MPGHAHVGPPITGGAYVKNVGGAETAYSKVIASLSSICKRGPSRCAQCEDEDQCNGYFSTMEVARNHLNMMSKIEEAGLQRVRVLGWLQGAAPL